MGRIKTIYFRILTITLELFQSSVRVYVDSLVWIAQKKKTRALKTSPVHKALRRLKECGRTENSIKCTPLRKTLYLHFADASAWSNLKEPSTALPSMRHPGSLTITILLLCVYSAALRHWSGYNLTFWVFFFSILAPLHFPDSFPLDIIKACKSNTNNLRSLFSESGSVVEKPGAQTEPFQTAVNKLTAQNSLQLGNYSQSLLRHKTSFTFTSVSLQWHSYRSNITACKGNAYWDQGQS